MDKLKSPKTVGVVLAMIVAALIAMFADSKPYVVAICDNVCPQVELKE